MVRIWQIGKRVSLAPIFRLTVDVTSHTNQKSLLPTIHCHANAKEGIWGGKYSGTWFWCVFILIGKYRNQSREVTTTNHSHCQAISNVVFWGLGNIHRSQIFACVNKIFVSKYEIRNIELLFESNKNDWLQVKHSETLFVYLSLFIWW